MKFEDTELLDIVEFIEAIIIFGGIVIITSMLAHVCTAESNDVIEFLETDTTNQREYLPYYSCGHFARDLARNASEYNISIGSIMLGMHPVFRGTQNHAMNYYIENGSIWLIEPQNDYICTLNNTMYAYYRLYPDGSQIPSNWKCNLAHTGEIL